MVVSDQEEHDREVLCIQNEDNEFVTCGHDVQFEACRSSVVV